MSLRWFASAPLLVALAFGATAAPAAAQAAAPAAPAAASVPRAKNFDARGMYLTATSMVLKQRYEPLMKSLKAAGGNMILFDAKDEGGIVSWQSKVPLAIKIGASKEGPIGDLKERVAVAHKLGIHVAGRIVCFNDPILAKKRPDLCPKHVRGGVWKENGRQVWVDPSIPEVQQYNIDLAKEMVEAGVDEVQFDYIRFPAQGDSQNARYAFDMKKTKKHEIITGYLTKAYDTLHPLGVLVSIDVYGIMAWTQDIDLRITGQSLEDIAKHVDVICPMLYPSHFSAGFGGVAHPADAPYAMVHKGLTLMEKRVKDSGVTIRPWLQAMPWRVSSFTPRYISEQIRASHDANAIGWMMWNAQNKYDTAFAGIKSYYAPKKK